MKKIVLIITSIGFGLMFTLRYSVELGICIKGSYSCITESDRWKNILFLSVFVLFFSLLTYKLPNKYFIKWWNFAKYAVPIILILTSVIFFELHHSDTGQMQNMFDAPILISLYLVFILGSVWQIYRAWRTK